MTNKQNNILEAALELFAKQGYHATSTSHIAKKASVSEGLIFRHFKNKEGLLEHILAYIEQKIHLRFTRILNEETPRDIIKKTLEMPFDMKKTEYTFWKIQFKLAWELNYSINLEQATPLKQALIKAFTNLRYKHPKLETQYLLQQIEGLSNTILKNGLDNQDEFKQFLLNKSLL